MFFFSIRHRSILLLLLLLLFGGACPPDAYKQTVQVLKHEYVKKPSLVGAGVFGLDDVFARVKPFVSRNLRPMLARQPGRSISMSRSAGAGRGVNGNRGGLPPLYFASVDIRHCYDTVDQVRCARAGPA